MIIDTQITAANKMAAVRIMTRIMQERAGTVELMTLLEWKKFLASVLSINPDGGPAMTTNDDDDYSWEYKRELARRKRFAHDLAIALEDPDNRRSFPGPWTAKIVVHDGPGIQLFDANERPVLTELLRDPQDAAQLLWSINHCRDI